MKKRRLEKSMSREDARRVLEQGREVFVLPSKRGARVAILLLGLTLLLVTVAERLRALFLVIAGVSLFRWGRDWHHVVVGVDGVLLERRTSRRFLAFGRIASLHVTLRTLMIELDDGEMIAVNTQDRRRPDNPLAHRIEQAITARRAALEALPRVSHASIVTSGEASPSRWLETLRRADYRQNAVPPEALEAAVLDPRAPVALRAVAALALAPHDGGEARRRLVAIAGGLADEDVALPLRRLSICGDANDTRAEMLHEIAERERARG